MPRAGPPVRLLRIGVDRRRQDILHRGATVGDGAAELKERAHRVVIGSVGQFFRGQRVGECVEQLTVPGSAGVDHHGIGGVVQLGQGDAALCEIRLG